MGKEIDYSDAPELDDHFFDQAKWIEPRIETSDGMKLPHIGKFLRQEIFHPLNLKIADAAELLDVSPSALSDLLDEDAPLSPEMALRFELAFGVPTDLLLRIQASYQAHKIRKRANEFNVDRYDKRRALDSLRHDINEGIKAIEEGRVATVDAEDIKKRGRERLIMPEDASE